ncbi:MAG: acylphosphatase [Methyloprofundus sp.]|nr:acylphosphatase [Methyloprofundus sp.]
MKHLKIIVKGRVQGVFFRKYTQEKALELVIQGTVKNRTDRNVEIYATGAEQAMQAFVAWCHEGPGLSQVSEVEISEISEQAEYNGFEVV